MTQLSVIEGIGPIFQEKLKKVGIRSIEALLEKGGKPKGRAEIEADLFRIKGVGSEYSDLLEEAGVDTVVELAQRRADNLYKAILDVNARKKLVRRPPTMDDVKSWIEQAKKLPRLVQY
jgi:predicted flap endonuclease-1-like 5' DNA nuclease